MHGQTVLAKKDNPVVVEFIEIQELKPTEHINPGRMRALAAQIQQMGIWTTPIMVHDHSGVIMDGHHRFHAAHLLQLKQVPCLRLSYDDPNLCVVRWAGGAPFPPRKVLQAGLSGALLDFKTTKHTYRLQIDFEPVVLGDLL